MSEFRRFFWGFVITILSFVGGIFLLVLDANAQTEEEDDSGFFTGLIDSFVDAINSAVNGISNFIGAIFQGIADFFSSAFQYVYDGAVDVLFWLWENIGVHIYNVFLDFGLHVFSHIFRMYRAFEEFILTIWNFGTALFNGEISILDFLAVLLASLWNLIADVALSAFSFLGFSTESIRDFFDGVLRFFGTDLDGVIEFTLEHLILLLPLLIGVGLVFLRLGLLALGKVLGAAWTAAGGFGSSALLSALLPALFAINALSRSAYGFILLIGLLLTIWNYAVAGLIPLIQSGSINLLGHLTTAIHNSVSPVGFITMEWLAQFVRFIVSTIFFILHLGAFWEILGYTVIGAFIRYVVNRFQITVSLN